ncbi:MAG: dTDP-4-dehydrorhamnose 3,5-epimerase family protein [Spirochaetales bacterium]
MDGCPRRASGLGDVRPVVGTQARFPDLRRALDPRRFRSRLSSAPRRHGTRLPQCTQEYNPESESGVLWNDPDLRIEWPEPVAEISAKDLALPRLKDAKVFPHDYAFKTAKP